MNAFAGLAIIVAALLGIAGWVMNIVKLFGIETLQFTGELIIRVVGIFIPFIGAIVGYF